MFYTAGTEERRDLTGSCDQPGPSAITVQPKSPTVRHTLPFSFQACMLFRHHQASAKATAAAAPRQMGEGDVTYSHILNAGDGRLEAVGKQSICGCHQYDTLNSHHHSSSLSPSWVSVISRRKRFQLIEKIRSPVHRKPLCFNSFTRCKPL